MIDGIVPWLADILALLGLSVLTLSVLGFCAFRTSSRASTLRARQA